MILPRRMLGRNVERGEIVEVGLDVGALGDREAQIGEDLADLVHHLTHGMDAPFLERAFAHRQSDVGALGCEPLGKRRRRERAALCLQRLTDSVLEPIDGLAVVSCAPRAAMRPSFAISSDTRPFLPSASTRTSSSARKVGSLGDGAKQLALDSLE